MLHLHPQTQLSQQRNKSMNDIVESKEKAKLRLEVFTGFLQFLVLGLLFLVLLLAHAFHFGNCADGTQPNTIFSDPFGFGYHAVIDCKPYQVLKDNPVSAGR